MAAGDGGDSHEVPRRVVGLGWAEQGDLPQVVLKSVGKNADEVIWESQRRSGPALVKDQRLLDALYRLPMDSHIPPELFHLVAAVLIHVAAIDGNVANKIPKKGKE